MRSLIVVRNGKFLDAGCGAGDFLVIAKHLGMDPYGVESGCFDSSLVTRHRIPVTKGTLIDVAYPRHFFDVVSLNHVFEHVPNPTEILTEIHRILKPGGHLILGVPTSDSLAHILFKKNWVQLDTPRHLFIFNLSTLQRYAKKTGFILERTRYTSTSFQFLGSLLYATNRFRKKQKYLSEKTFVNNRFLNVLFLPFAYLCNLFKMGDEIEITLKKV